MGWMVGSWPFWHSNLDWDHLELEVGGAKGDDEVVKTRELTK